MKVWYFVLHILLLFYSAGAIFSKTASRFSFLSKEYLICYGIVLGILGVYAIVWQQLLKKIPLTVAMANKSITVIWGFVYGFLFFSEKITIYNLIGAAFIICGVLFITLQDEEGN